MRNQRITSKISPRERPYAVIKNIFHSCHVKVTTTCLYTCLVWYKDALNELEKSLKNSNIVVLSFSYKENVGDPRESPAKTLIKNLKWKGTNITVVDPYIEEINPKFGVLNNDYMMLKMELMHLF